MKTKYLNVKTITLSTILILLTFFLCGCASVNFVTYHNSDGTINEYVYLSINEQKLIEYNYNPQQVKFEIKTNAYKEANGLILQFHDRLAEEYQLNHISNQEYATLYNSVQLIEQDWQNDKYLIGLQFSNSTTYKKYYELMSGATFNNNTKEVKKLFYTKTYTYGTTNFGDYSIFTKIYNYYSTSVFAPISPQETSLAYSYSVSSRRFHSDADSINLDSNGNYIHTWKVSPNEPNRNIHFYTIHANRSIWILVCIIITLITTLILSIIGLIKYHKDKKLKSTQIEINNPTPDITENTDNNIE